ncbi:hypothetical protein V7068_05595 [Bacillus sp. JJ634]
MKKLLSWLCIIGGFFWAVKPIYDALFNGKRWGEGYEPQDPTDYISFIFPLLCIGGLIVVYSLYKKEVRNSIMILISSAVLSGLFSFSEIYLYGSDLPFGLIFMLTGTMCMMIGSIYLFIQLKKVRSSTLFLSSTAITLFLDNFLLVALGILSDVLVLPEEISTPILVILFVSIGLIWSVFGFAILRLAKLDTINIQK